MHFLETAEPDIDALEIAYDISKGCGDGVSGPPFPIFVEGSAQDAIGPLDQSAEQTSGLKNRKTSPALTGNFLGEVAMNIFQIGHVDVLAGDQRKRLPSTECRGAFSTHHYIYMPAFNFVPKCAKAKYALVLPAPIFGSFLILSEIEHRLYLAWADGSVFEEQ